MLPRTASAPVRQRCDRTFLPFLYSTPTIRRQISNTSAGRYEGSPRPYTPSGIVEKASSDGGRESPSLPRRARLVNSARAQDRGYGRPQEWEGGRRPSQGKSNDGHARLDTRGSAKRTTREESIPFEHQTKKNAEETKVDWQGMESSSITPHERRIFEQLMLAVSKRNESSEVAMAPTSAKEKSKPKNTPETKALRAAKKALKAKDSDEDPEIVEVGAEAPLDNVEASSAITEAPSHKVEAFSDKVETLPDRVEEPEFEEPLSPILHKVLSKASESRLAPNATTSSTTKYPGLSAEAKQSLAQVGRIFAQAKTDEDLWTLLEKFVLHELEKMNLDGRSPKAKSTQTEANETTLNLRATAFLLAEHLADYLLIYLKTAETNFPSSHFPISLLPYLRSLGPATYALGASTALYNTHMAAYYARFPTDLYIVTDTLAEMDRLAYAFDGDTLLLLQRIETDARNLRLGKGGLGLKALWSTERALKGLRDVRHWKGVVKERSTLR